MPAMRLFHLLLIGIACSPPFVLGDDDLLPIVSEGFIVDVVAKEPLVRNPWDIAFDENFDWLGTDNDQTEGHKIFAPFFGSHFSWGQAYGGTIEDGRQADAGRVYRIHHLLVEDCWVKTGGASPIVQMYPLP
jgi:hypothetical protein